MVMVMLYIFIHYSSYTKQEYNYISNNSVYLLSLLISFSNIILSLLCEYDKKKLLNLSWAVTKNQSALPLLKNPYPLPSPITISTFLW